MVNKDIMKMLRESCNETQFKLARKIRVSREAYANYESGRRDMPYDTLANLSRHYHVSTDYLLCEAEQPYSFRELSGDRLFIAEKIFTLSDEKVKELAACLRKLLNENKKP